MSVKIQVTFTVDKDIKKNFQILCIKNGINMSETVESMMEQYVNITNKLVKEV